MKFLSNVLATLVGLIFFCVIFFLGIALLGLAMGSGFEKELKTPKDNSVLVLDLDNISQDHVSKTVITDFNMFGDEQEVGFIDVLNALEQAKTDDKIKGISMYNTSATLGLAQMKALRDKLEEFKQSGKFVVSYADHYTQSHYYLSSIADTIYLNPAGALDFRGLASELLFFKDFQDKTGVQMEVIRHGKYKSAMEPFMENQMSAENRQQIKELLNSVWQTIVTDVSETRNIAVDRLNTIADDLEARTPELALQNKLIDKIVYQDEYQQSIKAALDVKKEDDYNSIDLTEYALAKVLKPKKETHKIAVIYAQGQIIDGEGNAQNIGDGFMLKALQEAAKDKDVKAVVLRVDSPGGSALASEIIWREIELVKKQKPVIVSMGNVAASGGYYISCNANRIFAEPTTITGSIGIFGAVPNFKKLANNLGIHADMVTTHKNAMDYSPFQPVTESFKQVTTEGIEIVYNTFLKRVAEGRGMTTEAVNEIAQGRVWTGTDAQRIGLVDEIGGLEDALQYAAELTKIDAYSIKNLPVFRRTLKEFFSENSPFPFVKTKEAILKEELGAENYKIIEQIKAINSYQGIQTVMPYQLIIR